MLFSPSFVTAPNRELVSPRGPGEEDAPGPWAPRRLGKLGVSEADLEEVGRILEYNQLFSPDNNIYRFARKL